MIVRLRAVVALLAAAVLLTACGGGGPASAGPAPTEAGDGAFPITVQHALGTTEIPAAPQRVVSLGYTDQDTILAFGVVPVGIREFTGNRPSATWPWASDRLRGEQPRVLVGEQIDVETVAALQPDLIVAVSAGLDQQQYDTFSRLAPTIAHPVGADPFQAAWQDTTRLIGAALGRAEEAERMVADLEARFAAVREQYPQFQGRRAAIAAASSTGTGYFVWASDDNRGRFLTSLGFTVPPVFDELAGDSFYADISHERLDLLDENDVVGWLEIPGNDNAALDAQPGYPALRVGREGRVVELTQEQGVALSFSSVLSLPALLDELPAEFAAHLGG
ncbi:MAG TPA: iron-siderophore ABC transporter substrate-binding protein [Pseudonocardia sp.]|uniref:iron-siderophore ABC transporter substrate-binding protein n=1 Tax=Pseudonocardia sp. TaxID=60912 RepID=UPI002B4B39FD|nr:iron-siderophore ABC transporter substrate-binding protein [Pseudonocardia sp.]HLU56693.1 iron-siderophore ABC transporter substrate-binding protein [Pseudonocardia sp.]